MADLVILIPALGRSHTIVPLIRSIRETCDASVLFLVTHGDREVIGEIDSSDPESDWLESKPQASGDYAKKINTGFMATTEPYVFLGATDIIFHPGWWEAALAVLRHPSEVGVVGTNDLNLRRGERRNHATHFVVRRSYVDQFGTIDEPGLVLHEGYAHEMVDDELIGTAKFRHKYHYAEDSIVEHMHPLWGRSPSDAMYEASGLRMRKSRRLYQQRKQMWT